MRKKSSAEIEIMEASAKGNGIGYIQHQNGKRFSVEVPFTIPGDKVRAILLRKRGGVYKSLLEEIIEPSPRRIQPRCIHFNTCGGCRSQQITYEEQLALKEGYVKRCFASSMTEHTTFKPIFPCDPPWHYRNKMEFSFSNNAAKEHFLGLVIDSSKGKVFNLTECHLVNSWFADCVNAVRLWWKDTGLEAFHPMRNTGSLRTLTVREGQRTGDRMVILTVSGNPDYSLKKHHLESFVACVRDAIEPKDPSSYLSVFLRIQQTAKGMATNFYEMLLYGPDHIREILHVTYHPNEKPLSLMFKVSPSAFFQPNTRQAEQLYSLALQHLQIPQGTIVYDLYCGTGTLGICAAKQAKQVVGIELSPESSLDARANVAANGFDNVEIIYGSVAEALEMIRSEKKQPLPDIVMIDPPRAGLEPKAIKQILDLSPFKILYISCNPVTQAQNVVELLAAGYKMTAMQPIDQFPQTVHVENIVVLERLQP